VQSSASAVNAPNEIVEIGLTVVRCKQRSKPVEFLLKVLALHPVGVGVSDRSLRRLTSLAVPP
jgi:hypothetical protein